LAPNLAKVAPAVSISYLIYENSKAFLGLAWIAAQQQKKQPKKNKTKQNEK
jgi:hypothetical protein